MEILLVENSLDMTQWNFSLLLLTIWQLDLFDKSFHFRTEIKQKRIRTFFCVQFCPMSVKCNVEQCYECYVFHFSREYIATVKSNLIIVQMVGKQCSPDGTGYNAMQCLTVHRSGMTLHHIVVESHYNLYYIAHCYVVARSKTSATSTLNCTLYTS